MCWKRSDPTWQEFEMEEVRPLFKCNYSLDRRLVLSFTLIRKQLRYTVLLHIIMHLHHPTLWFIAFISILSLQFIPWNTRLTDYYILNFVLIVFQALSSCLFVYVLLYAYVLLYPCHLFYTFQAFCSLDPPKCITSN